MEFNIGDRVESVRDCPQRKEQIRMGDFGTVCDLRRTYPPIGVRWDANIGGHNCFGCCSLGHGFYVESSEISLVCDDDSEQLCEISVSDLLDIIGEYDA